ncbi:MAG: hypothetical protein OXU70_15835, partial [Gammaproteobacteria bacterium]|nr:hypothetical protein [Gammaproteobacteria bacterium]
MAFLQGMCVGPLPALLLSLPLLAGVVPEVGAQTERAVSIVRGISPITEGMSANFTIRADSAPTADLPISVKITESGVGNDFLDPSDEGTRMVTVPNGQLSATFAIATVDNDACVNRKQIAAQVIGGTGYTVRRPSAASVVVDDNDCPDSPPPPPDTPVASFAAASSSAGEGAG